MGQLSEDLQVLLSDGTVPMSADEVEEIISLTLGSALDEPMRLKLDAHVNSAGRIPTTKNAGTRKKKTPKMDVIDALTAEDTTFNRPNGDLYVSRTWGEHNDVLALRTARENNYYSLLYGAPGTGKTALVEAAFGDDLYTILGSGDTEVSDLVGGYIQTASGGFEWIDGPLVKAAEEGKTLFIDEIGLIDPKVLSTVYGLMDGRREYNVTQNPQRGVVKAQPGFYVVAATNPNAPGVRLSEALLSRFILQVEMTTDWILAKKLGVPAVAVTCAQNLARKLQTGEVGWAPQMRELLAFREISKSFGTKFAIANLLASAPELDRPVVADVFSRAFGEEHKPARI